MAYGVVIEFSADDGTRLAGTLTLPNAARPVAGALLLSGSGPLDRDSNMPQQRLDVAAALAAALAAHGVASLRFDKRGVGASGGEYLSTGFHREMSDGGAALAALQGSPSIDPKRVAIAGHSVGATIAIRLAAADAPQPQASLAGGGTPKAGDPSQRLDKVPPIGGVVLLAGAARPGAEVMEWQSARIAATLPRALRPLGPLFMRMQARGRRRLRASTADIIRVNLSRSPARWMREYMAYDPAADLPAIRCPVLAVTGCKDVQVDAVDIDRMRELVDAPFTGHTPADLTHVLHTTSGPPGLAGYRAQLRKPPDPALMERVATWIRDRTSS
jgi:dienelactone hydrolase